MSEDPRRSLPSVDKLARSLGKSAPGWAAREAARQAVAEARAALEAGDEDAPVGPEAVEERARALLAQLAPPRPRRVVNATGVVLHTNLGRSALAPGAAAAAAGAGAGYSDLELDLATGSRGNRLAGLDTLLRTLSGAEAGMAVNNNAAAVLLALNTLARGREVVVSRGELVEIGGSFRVPAILEQAGVRLVEVGTTNRTHPSDYRDAIGPETGVLLKVHRSNFEQRGFVAEVGLPELVGIGREAGVPVVDDLGSATLADLRALGLPADSYAPTRVESGADVVCFSGDKLLGGPQAGLLLGRAEAIAAIRANPMARALRLGKMSLAALDWTLRAYAEGREDALPTVRMLREPAESVEARARELAERARKGLPPAVALDVVSTRAPVGGGSLPGFTLESRALAVGAARGAEALAGALRAAPVPVLARVEHGRLLLDVRTLLPGDEEAVAAALAAALV